MIYRICTCIILFVGSLFTLGKKESLKPHECYANMVKCYKMKSFNDASKFAKLILESEAKEPYEGDVHFYVGASSFEMNELELANEHLSLFLEKWATTKFFKKAVELKYKIARKYQSGFKKHVMGYQSLPKLESGYEDALLLYDEVIGLLPRDELAAKSMFYKAQLKIDDAKFNDSVQIFETLIQHFPQHELASKSYLMIANVRMMQCSKKSLGQNYLDLSQKNLREFEHHFKNDKRVDEARAIFIKMQNLFAQDLYNSAKYFEKKKNFRGALLFYQSILQKFPDSSYAAEINHRIDELKKRI